MTNIVHVVGTGTIGEPLIGLLARHKHKLGIDEVTFYKNTPNEQDKAKVKQLLGRGALLTAHAESIPKFESMGLKVSFNQEEAIRRATVVIDCTPGGCGLENKRLFYEKYKDSVKGFIAQGSEFGFGSVYARGIVQMPKDEQFIQVVSCNTHNIAAILKSLEASYSSVTPGGIYSGDFVCLRRANDISQNGGFVPSTSVGKHGEKEFGTHHARDAFHLVKNEFPNIRLFSSAVKLNTQYMHAIRFSVHTDHVGDWSIESVLQRFENNPYVALTDKTTSNTVFSFGRDYGLYGRILSQTVVVRPTVSVRKVHDGFIVTGFCFTPQDGNSLLSSIAATLHFLDPSKVDERISCYHPYIFQEI